MNAEELKFVGLATNSSQKLLDSDEKVKRLREELAKSIEANAKQWEAVKRDSQEKANQCFLS